MNTIKRIGRYLNRVEGTNYIRITNADDNSPQYKHWESGKYNPDCACCWLGIAHSEQYHNKEVK